MKRIRAYDKQTGEFAGEMHAKKDMSESLRHAFNFCCLNPGCSKPYHWQKGHKRNENTQEIDPLFAENKSGAHAPDCQWDFVKKASTKSGIAFAKGGFYHLRINFPLGGSWTDNYPRKGRLTRHQIASVKAETGLKGVSCLKDTVKFLEKEFATLEAEQMDYLKLHYQGRDYAWSDLYAAPDNYAALVDVPRNEADDTFETRLTMVNIVTEIAPNAKQKRRFLCEAQQGTVRARDENIRPIIVCEDDKMADILAEISIRNQSTVLVAARPFIPPAFFKTPPWKRGDVPVSLYVANAEQIAPVSNKYWPHAPTVSRDSQAQPMAAPRH